MTNVTGYVTLAGDRPESWTIASFIPGTNGNVHAGVKYGDRIFRQVAVHAPDDVTDNTCAPDATGFTIAIIEGRGFFDFRGPFKDDICAAPWLQKHGHQTRERVMSFGRTA